MPPRPCSFADLVRMLNAHGYSMVHAHGPDLLFVQRQRYGHTTYSTFYTPRRIVAFVRRTDTMCRLHYRVRRTDTWCRILSNVRRTDRKDPNPKRSQKNQPQPQSTSTTTTLSYRTMTPTPTIMDLWTPTPLLSHYRMQGDSRGE